MNDARRIADDVRSGARSARDVLDEHLDAIGRREPEVHAFNTVLADDGRICPTGVVTAGCRLNDP